MGGMIALNNKTNQYVDVPSTKKTASLIMNQENVTRAKPAGIVTGIYAKTNGVLVLEVIDYMDTKQRVKSPATGKLEQGDYIVKCNGKNVNSKEALTKLLDQGKKNEVTLKILHNGAYKDVKIKPVLEEGHYKIGVWVRDDIAGLGTITMYTEQNRFLALGHCISDMDLGVEIDVSKGSIHPCRLTDIRKGKKNQPGALIGYIDYQPDNPIAAIEHNTEQGISGNMLKIPKEMERVDYLPVASKDEISIGKAELINDLSGKRKSYDIEILRINRILPRKSKDFVVKITDKELIKKTGGIVQGMSGSPIIQNGKIIGALTHVFVNDPTKGYGILIENMLK